MPQFGREGPTHEHALDSLDRPVYGGGMLDIDPGRGAVANAAAPGLGTGIGVLVSSFAVQWLPAATRLVYLVGRLRTRRRKLGIQRSIATSGYDRRVSGVEFLAGPLAGASADAVVNVCSTSGGQRIHHQRRRSDEVRAGRRALYDPHLSVVTDHVGHSRDCHERLGYPFVQVALQGLMPNELRNRDEHRPGPRIGVSS
jgi:hypothetical protein